jgi:hypothetical protein
MAGIDFCVAHWIVVSAPRQPRRSPKSNWLAMTVGAVHNRKRDPMKRSLSSRSIEVMIPGTCLQLTNYSLLSFTGVDRVIPLQRPSVNSTSYIELARVAPVLSYVHGTLSIQHRFGCRGVRRLGGQGVVFPPREHELVRRTSARVSLMLGDQLLSRGAIYQYHNPPSVYLRFF